MKVDPNTVLMALDGVTPLKSPIDAEKQATFAEAAIMSLMDERTENPTGMEKFRRFTLATKIQSATDALDLSLEDAALIKDQVGKMFAPIVVGRMWAILDA